MSHYAVVFLLRPPYLLSCEPFFERRNACKNQGKLCPRKGVAIANHCAIVNLLHIVNVYNRIVFLVRRGPLGMTSQWPMSVHLIAEWPIDFGPGMVGTLDAQIASDFRSNPPGSYRSIQIFTRHSTTLNPKVGLDYRGRVPDASP